MNDTNKEIEIDLLKLLQALWHKAWAIFLSVAIIGGAFFAASVFLLDPMYKAEALIYVNSRNTSIDGTKGSISQSELTAAQTLVDTYIVILNSRETIDAVIAKAGVPYSYGYIMSNEMIHASAVNGTEIFRVEVTSPNPTEAALLANTIAEVLPDKISSIVEGTSARIVSNAITPTAPSSPNIIKNTLIGAILGFVLACAVIIIIDLMDDLIHDSDYLSETYDLPVLAVIPDLLSKKRNNNAYYQYAETNIQK